jgi:hypothetical protein
MSRHDWKRWRCRLLDLYDIGIKLEEMRWRECVWTGAMN